MLKENKKLSPEFLAMWKRMQARKRQETVFDTPEWAVEEKYEKRYKQFDQEEWGF